MTDAPLITNRELDALLNRAKGMSDTNRDTMYEALVFVRGTYERRIAELESVLTAERAAWDELMAHIIEEAGQRP